MGKTNSSRIIRRSHRLFDETFATERTMGIIVRNVRVNQPVTFEKSPDLSRTAAS